MKSITVYFDQLAVRIPIEIAEKFNLNNRQVVRDKEKQREITAARTAYLKALKTK